MGLVQESNVNGIGPREQCEWDLAMVQESTDYLMTTHDRIQPVSGAHENLGHVGAASRAFGASRRSTACLPACLPACHYCTHSCLVPACLPATAPLLWPPARLSSPLTLSSRARMHLGARSSLFLSLLRLLLFLSQPRGASSSAASNSDLSLLHPLHVCFFFFFFLAFQLSF